MCVFDAEWWKSPLCSFPHFVCFNWDILWQWKQSMGVILGQWGWLYLCWLAQPHNKFLYKLETILQHRVDNLDHPFFVKNCKNIWRDHRLSHYLVTIMLLIEWISGIHLQLLENDVVSQTNWGLRTNKMPLPSVFILTWEVLTFLFFKWVFMLLFTSWLERSGCRMEKKHSKKGRGRGSIQWTLLSSSSSEWWVNLECPLVGGGCRAPPKAVMWCDRQEARPERGVKLYVWGRSRLEETAQEKQVKIR